MILRIWRIETFKYIVSVMLSKDSVLRWIRLSLMDGDLGDRKAKYIVRESEDGAILIDQEYDEIPVGWKKSPCDLENLRDRHVSYYDQCYVTENDKRVKIHNIVIYNSLGYEWYHFYEVTQSEDDKYEVGDINSSMIDKWSRVECEMPDMENRFLDTTDTCYDTGNGTVKIKASGVY